MRYYDKKENKVSRWHKSKIKWFQEKTGLTDYQLMWASFAKGLIIGLLIL
tara:strand:- start:1232 stop:1381 length:150 start_codon:yes stop_codon:yes gene_type:complete